MPYYWWQFPQLRYCLENLTICPRSFAYRPKIQFSDNSLVADMISQHTSRPKRFMTTFAELRHQYHYSVVEGIRL